MRDLDYYCNKFIDKFPGKGRLGVIPNPIGCTVDVVLGAKPLIMGLTKREAFYALAAIINYEYLQDEEKKIMKAKRKQNEEAARNSAGWREKYAIRNGKRTIRKDSRGHEIWRFAYSQDHEYQDANGAEFDATERRWVG